MSLFHVADFLHCERLYHTFDGSGKTVPRTLLSVSWLRTVYAKGKRDADASGRVAVHGRRIAFCLKVLHG